ncbi:MULTISPECIES: beta-ketoacyl synthase chain length factor [unclassified Cobetia]|uniref:beta-ketoacyl synthase chain length factor n=1 Tax=unclassified Cobetia TaxID=2609414 RepID=UPI00209832A9|nr:MULTISPECIES: beta-ketoacyl synthase chain length factor [unclassified Cobetia]MCO7231343.1 beta-ketoacyl synthase chain length factor [Cobetia sp. Dlab-2-AX]MCO7234248.1 beta-ketoacyl synthase chain length factor [Cobetia sp. Dlab-2-U]
MRLTDWRAWQASATRTAHDSRVDITPSPRAEQVPAMQRRRLSPVGQACCKLLFALDPDADLPIIHASRHGDTGKILALLDAATQSDEALSPARFSLSVHNAVLGMYSITGKSRQPLEALAACGHEFEALMSEALGYLSEREEVIVLFSDIAAPEAFLHHGDYPACASAVALRLSRRSDDDSAWTLSATPADSLSGSAPTPLEVITWLEQAGAETLVCRRQQWQLNTASSRPSSTPFSSPRAD